MTASTVRCSMPAWIYLVEMGDYFDSVIKPRIAKVVYSEGWKAMKLPNVEANTGFDYECRPADGVCQATETGTEGPVANGIRIDIETGEYACLGAYKPVTTQGFDGAEITVGCRASQTKD